MKTIIIEKINEHEVIKGFSDPVIEPVETSKNVADILVDTPEVKAHANKLTEIEGRKDNIRKTRKIISTAWNKKNDPNSTEADKLSADESVRKISGNMKVEEEKLVKLIEDLRGINVTIQAKKKVIFSENLTYFEPATGEEIITDEKYNEYQGILANLTDHQKLCKDCSVIPDYRGVEYWLKDEGWTKNVIEKINIPLPGIAVLPVDLTPENIAEITTEAETRRITGLSAADKTAEKQLVIDGVATQAAAMRSKLEIQGTAAAGALKTSQDWYNAEVVVVEDKYK